MKKCKNVVDFQWYNLNLKKRKNKIDAYLRQKENFTPHGLRKKRRCIQGRDNEG